MTKKEINRMNHYVIAELSQKCCRWGRSALLPPVKYNCAIKVSKAYVLYFFPGTKVKITKNKLFALRMYLFN